MWIHHRDLKQMKSRQWGNPVMCGAINLSRSLNNCKLLTTESWLIHTESVQNNHCCLYHSHLIPLCMKFPFSLNISQPSLFCLCLIHAHDDVQWCSHLVRHRCQELWLGVVGCLCLVYASRELENAFMSLCVCVRAWANQIFSKNWPDFFRSNFKAMFEGLGLRV